MKKKCMFILFATVLLALGCQTVPTEVPEDLTAPELFQRAQEYADSNNFSAALIYVQAIQQRFSTERLILVTAQYHEALYLQQAGRIPEAKNAYELLINRFDQEPNLPAWILTLSQKKLAEIDTDLTGND